MTTTQKAKACSKCWASYTAEEWLELEATTNPEATAAGAESRMCAHCSEVLSIDRTFLESLLRDDGNNREVPTDAELEQARTALELLAALVKVGQGMLGPRK